MSFNRSAQNVQLTGGNLIIVDADKKIRSSKYEFADGGSDGAGTSVTLQDVTEQGASTDRTVTFSNVTTALIVSSNVNTSDRLAFRQTRYGYSTTYRVLQYGNCASESSISLGYDPIGNNNGQFTGDEILIPYDKAIIAPTSDDTGYVGILRLSSSNILQIGGSNYSTAGHIKIDQASGNVGIGTTIPSHKLEVNAKQIAGQPVCWIHNSNNVPDTDGTVISAVNDGSDSEVLHVRTNNTTYNGGTSLMLVRGDGKVGIGTNSPTKLLSLKADSATCAIKLERTSATDTGSHGQIGFSSVNGIVCGLYSLASGDSNGGHLIFTTTNTTPRNDVFDVDERMRITSTGNVGIGDNSPDKKLSINGYTRNYFAGDGSGAISPGFVEVIHTGFNISAQETIPLSNIQITNNTRWKAILKGVFDNNFEGGGLVRPALEIEVDSTNNVIDVGSTDLEFSVNSTTNKLQVKNTNGTTYRVAFTGIIEIYTAPQAAMSPSSKVIIGNVGIGGSPDTRLVVQKDSSDTDLFGGNGQDDTLKLYNEQDTTGNYTSIGFVGNSNELTSRIASVASASNGRGSLHFIVCLDDSSSRHDTLILDAQGSALINTNSTIKNAIGSTSFISQARTGFTAGTFYQPSTGTGNIDYSLVVRHQNPTDGRYIRFITDNNIETGRIFYNSGTMLYSSSSDKRLKSNVETISEGLNELMKINPVKFNWNNTGVESRGFLAQDLHEVYPWAVGVGDEDPNTNPWSVDYSKLIPLLVKAIQELKAEIDMLKSS